MIQAVLILNQKGKVRLQKVYDEQTFTALGFSMDQIQQELFQRICAKRQPRSADVDCYANFVGECETLPHESKIVFRTYATLTFVFIIDEEESELGILDLIQVFVEILDNLFKNVCEVDLVFNPHKLGYVLDELIVDGLVCETNIKEVGQIIEAMDQIQ